MTSSAVRGVGACVPHRLVTNDELAGRLDTSDEWIRSRTGIRTRRWVDPRMSTSDLAVEAGLLGPEIGRAVRRGRADRGDHDTGPAVPGDRA